MKTTIEIMHLELGALLTNCYILLDSSTKQAYVIDPADEGKRIAALVDSKGYKIRKILLTHGHYDHIGGVTELIQQTGARIWIHEKDADCLTHPEKNFSVFLGRPFSAPEADGFFGMDERIRLGDHEIHVFHTPGHTPGSVSFAVNGSLIVGDTLFQGSIGRTDFPGSSAEILLESIHLKLMVFPDETKVYPGHGPSTTIGRERKENPFLEESPPYI